MTKQQAMKKQQSGAPLTGAPKLTGRLEVDTERGTFLGDTRIRLLEAIAAQGSISRAAKFVPLSYKAAWDAVDAMNNLAEKPLVTRATGGKNGGGTQLTDYGRKVIELYRALEGEYQLALERLAASMNEGEAGTLQEFRRLLQRMAIKTSARNQFAGRIVGIKAEEVDFEVRLKLDDANELTATVTHESAENLGLKIGMEVWALAKAPAVRLLVVDETPAAGWNVLTGVLDRIHRGAAHSEITVTLPGGKCLCSVVANRRIPEALAPGDSVRMAIAATSIVLCVPA
ncbi:MAG: TOBE domain-containing protein [Azoarcus sp.]|nr:TOBE domain-containing protein [Azoarcus sp.]